MRRNSPKGKFVAEARPPDEMDVEDFDNRSLEASKYFSPAAPVDESELFAGRIDQLRAVIDAVRQRGQHAIIFGERGVGKTSLANVLVGFFPDDGEQIVARRVNCDSSDDFSSVWRKVFNDIQFSSIKAGVGFVAEDTVQAQTLSDVLPQELTIEDVRLCLTSLAAQSLPIIVIDEFDRIQSEEARTLVADTIKTLSDQLVGATIVLVGVADSVDELIKEHESIERALVQIQMPRMSVEELERIITNGLERLGMEIDEDALDRITLLSQGLPHYTHLLGLNSCRQALDDQSLHVAPHDVESAIDKALENAQQSIRNAYLTATTSPRAESLYRQVLLACALAKTDELGFFSPADVRDPMSAIMGKLYDIPSFSRHLKEFSEDRRGPVLQRIGEERRFRFRFVNPLMQPYVTMRGVADGLITNDQIVELQS